MAIQSRRPGTGLVHHPDRGYQYTSYVFGRLCKEAGIVPSMSSVGDAYDNAAAESFFATLECELIDRNTFRNRTEARMAVFDFIDVFYNRKRRHSSIGGCSRPSTSKGSTVRPRLRETGSELPGSRTDSENGSWTYSAPRLRTVNA